MRWRKRSLIAGWVGLHASLWIVLPPIPELRLPAANDFAFADNGKLIVTVNRQAVRVFDTATGRLERTRTGKTLPLTGFSNYGESTLAVAGRTRRAVVYTTAAGDQADGFLLDLNDGRPTPLPLRPGRLRDGDLRITPDGTTVAYLVRSDGDSGAFRICIWNISTGEVRYLNRDGKLNRLVAAPDGANMAIIADTQKGLCLEIVDLSTAHSFGREIFEKCNWSEPPTFIPMFSPDGRRFSTMICGGSEYWIAVWSAEGGWRRFPMPDLGFVLNWRDGGRLEWWDWDGQRRCIDPASGEISELPNAPFPTAEGFYFETNGRVVFSRNRQWPAVLGRVAAIRRIAEWVNTRHCLNGYFDWHILDRTGDKIAALPAAGYPAINPDGTRWADLSPDGDAVVVYALPPRYPYGLILGLMIAEAGLALGWIGWRGRSAPSWARAGNDEVARTLTR
jgi:hypothetical protein